METLPFPACPGKKTAFNFCPLPTASRTRCNHKRYQAQPHAATLPALSQFNSACRTASACSLLDASSRMQTAFIAAAWSCQSCFGSACSGPGVFIFFGRVGGGVQFQVFEASHEPQSNFRCGKCGKTDEQNIRKMM